MRSFLQPTCARRFHSPRSAKFLKRPISAVSRRTSSCSNTFSATSVPRRMSCSSARNFEKSIRVDWRLCSSSGFCSNEGKTYEFKTSSKSTKSSTPNRGSSFAAPHVGASSPDASGARKNSLSSCN